MGRGHDFTAFPELTNAQMEQFYFDSPHKQIFEDFDCKVVKVHDGDTITVRWSERRFDFPIRFSDVAAPELSEDGGYAARDWLERKLLNENITVQVNPRNRVEKFGRLLGRIIHRGVSIGEEAVATGLVSTWQNRKDGKIPELSWAVPSLENVLGVK